MWALYGEWYEPSIEVEWVLCGVCWCWMHLDLDKVALSAAWDDDMVRVQGSKGAGFVIAPLELPWS